MPMEVLVTVSWRALSEQILTANSGGRSSLFSTSGFVTWGGGRREGRGGEGRGGEGRGGEGRGGEGRGGEGRGGEGRGGEGRGGEGRGRGRGDGREGWEEEKATL